MAPQGTARTGVGGKEPPGCGTEGGGRVSRAPKDKGLSGGSGRTGPGVASRVGGRQTWSATGVAAASAVLSPDRLRAPSSRTAATAATAQAPAPAV